MKILIVASNNKGKIKEIKQILGGLYDIISMGEAGINLDVDETGTTFEENAVIKALAIYRLVNAAGINNAVTAAVISDDSGLSVDVLGGEPGIYSARYSGHGTDEANNQKLLANLKGESNRKGRFISVVALVKSEDNIVVARGECEGEILHMPKGGGGFGYDPLFYSYDLNKTFGEAKTEEKNAVSHRAKALENLLNKLKRLPD